ncbi:MAG: matrixin family metalloprotease, partial [bacterium]
MKKVLAIFLIILTAIFIWFFGKMLPDILTNAGKIAYEIGDYQKAFSSLKMAIKLSPKNCDARYYYVQTLIKLPPTLNIQKELYSVAQMNLSDSADLIADRQISKWRNQILFKTGENYIEQAPLDSKILKWDTTKFPLKVYIGKNSLSAPQYYQDEIKKAFLQWQASTGRFINVEFINDENSADIRVSINSSADMKKCTQDSCKYTVAYTTPVINNDLLKRMDIFFYDSNNLGKPFSEREIYNTALHEIGHALGIMGHSYNKDDLMYMETNTNNNKFNGLRSDFQLISSNDLNTLNLLYKLIPDITNTPLSKFDTSYQLFAPIVMGSDKQINSKKMLEAQNYIKAAPDLPNGYIDLASAYSEENQY